MAITATYIVPHPPLLISEVGRGQEKKIQNTIDSYKKVAQDIAEQKPETIVIITPHSIMYEDYIHISPGREAFGNLKKFGEYKLSFHVEYDNRLVNKIEESAGQKGIPAGTLGERDKAVDHGSLVPIYFIDQYYQNYKVVRISVSGLTYLEHYRFGKCLQEAVKALNRNVVIVASGDLSHRLKEEGAYSFAEEGPIFDAQVTEAMAKADFMSFLKFDEGFCEAAGECGLRSFIIMAGALDGKAVEPEFLSYEAPFGVGYAVCKYLVSGDADDRNFDELYKKEQKKCMEKIKMDEDDYVKLARLSLETYIKERKNLKRPNQLPKELIDQKAGVFVSLKKYGRLRGCIGTISPVEDSVADEIIQNAVSAGVGDPRFQPITEDELPDIVYSVDVLEKPEPIQSISQLDPKQYGVIVSKGRKRGLLLPNLEGVTTPEQQISIALKKAGISEDETFNLERFKVVRHK